MTTPQVWSTLVASGVAAAGLVSMVWLGTWIVGAADSMRVPAGDAAAAKAPEKPKSLAELIAERKVRAALLCCVNALCAMRCGVCWCPCAPAACACFLCCCILYRA